MLYLNRSPWAKPVWIVVAIVLVVWMVITLTTAFGDDSGDTEWTATIDDLTVSLRKATDNDSGIQLRYDYDHDDRDVIAYHIGVPVVKYADGSETEAVSGEILSDGDTLINFKPGPGIATVDDETVVVDMGSWAIESSQLAGAATIPLGSNLGNAIPEKGKVSTLSIQSDLVSGSSTYRISELILDRQSYSENFRLKIVPSNDDERETELASGNSATVSLSDNNGNPYIWVSTRTSWNHVNGQKKVEWQQLIFDGLPKSNASSLTLSVRGGNKVVGPFIFEDVRLDDSGVEPGAGTPSGSTGSVGD